MHPPTLAPRVKKGCTSGTSQPPSPHPPPPPPPPPPPSPSPHPHPPPPPPPPPPPSPPVALWGMDLTFSDSMVLQHSEPVIAGRCVPPATLTASLWKGGASVAVTSVSDAPADTVTVECGNDGRFLAQMAPQQPSGDLYTIKVEAAASATQKAPLASSFSATATRVMFGSVIVCGGESYRWTYLVPIVVPNRSTICKQSCGNFA